MILPNEDYNSDFASDKSLYERITQLFQDRGKEFQIVFDFLQIIDTPKGKAYAPGFGVVPRKGILEIGKDYFTIEGNVADEAGIHKGIILIPFDKIRAIQSFSPIVSYGH